MAEKLKILKEKKAKNNIHKNFKNGDGLTLVKLWIGGNFSWDVPEPFCLALLNCFSCVWLFVTPGTVPCQAPLSIKFFQQLERVAISYSRGSSPPREQTCLSPVLECRFFTTTPPGKPIIYTYIWWLRWWRIRLQCGRPRFSPWVGRIPWRRTWYLL